MSIDWVGLGCVAVGLRWIIGFRIPNFVERRPLSASLSQTKKQKRLQPARERGRPRSFSSSAAFALSWRRRRTWSSPSTPPPPRAGKRLLGLLHPGQRSSVAVTAAAASPSPQPQPQLPVPPTLQLLVQVTSVPLLLLLLPHLLLVPATAAATDTTIAATTASKAVGFEGITYYSTQPATAASKAVGVEGITYCSTQSATFCAQNRGCRRDNLLLYSVSFCCVLYCSVPNVQNSYHQASCLRVIKRCQRKLVLHSSSNRPLQ